MEFFQETINLRRGPDSVTIFGRKRNWRYFFKKTMTMRRSPYSQTVFRRKKTRIFSYKIIEYGLSIDIEIIFGKNKWSFSKKQLIWEGDPIVWPFSEEKETEGISSKKQWLWGGHLIPRQFLEGKKHGFFHIKSLNTGCQSILRSFLEKTNGVFPRNN